jgi:hypothetical protein
MRKHNVWLQSQTAAEARERIHEQRGPLFDFYGLKKPLFEHFESRVVRVWAVTSPLGLDNF